MIGVALTCRTLETCDSIQRPARALLWASRNRREYSEWADSEMRFSLACPVEAQGAAFVQRRATVLG